MNDRSLGTVSEKEIKEFLRRAEMAHFGNGYFLYEGKHILTRHLFASGVDAKQKAREMILDARQASH